MYYSLILAALLSMTGTDNTEHSGVKPRTAPTPLLAQAPLRRPSKSAEPLLPVEAETPATFEPVATTAPGAPEPSSSGSVQTSPNMIQTVGLLQVPKWNNVVLAANFQAILMSLKTEQRDAGGNAVADEKGDPILIPIREGMHVVKGQTLGRFDDRELNIQLAIQEKKLEVAKKAREKKIEIEYAEKQVKTAWANAEMFKATNRLVESAISKIEILKAELELEQAKANYQLQEYTIDIERAAEVEVQEQEVEGMKVRIAMRQLVAPISGMVVKIEKAEGEWLREGDPVLEIVQLDTLQAECIVDAKQSTPDMVEGKEATVYVSTIHGKTEEFPGKVVFADQTVKSGDTFKVYIEIQNQRRGGSWQVQPGRSVTATIRL